MTNTKITEREIYEGLKAGTLDHETICEFADRKLAQLDKRNESAKVRAAKKRAEGDALMSVVAEFVGDEPKTREDITSEMLDAGHDVTIGKVQSRLNKLVANGSIAKAKGKVAGEDGKNKTVTLYAVEFAEVE